MPCTIPRLRNLSWDKIPPILVLSQRDLMSRLKYPYEKNKLMYKNCLNLEPDYQVDDDMKEWLIRGHVSIHETTNGLGTTVSTWDVLFTAAWSLNGCRFVEDGMNGKVADPFRVEELKWIRNMCFILLIFSISVGTTIFNGENACAIQNLLSSCICIGVNDLCVNQRKVSTFLRRRAGRMIFSSLLIVSSLVVFFPGSLSSVVGIGGGVSLVLHYFLHLAFSISDTLSRINFIASVSPNMLK
ncbi:hypothetical protein Tco_1302535 [Tanacetum coccineum]